MTMTMTMAEVSWMEEISMDDYFHCLKGSPSNHIKTLGLFGVASVFCVPVAVHAQSEECEEGFEMIMSITDGARHEEDGKTRKADKDRIVRLDKKDFLGMTDVYHQEGHFPCVETKGECPVDKRIP